MYEEENSFAGYDSNGLTPQDLLARLVALQSRLASTMSEVKREDGALKQQQSQIIQDVDLIQLSVLDMDSRLGTAESSITQTAYDIAQKVSMTDYNGNTIASLINQTATTVKILAKNIDLIGAVTVLSDITGNLGTITAGNIYGINIFGGYISSDTTIDIGQDLTIGKNGASYFDYSSLNFGNYASITAYRNGGLSEIHFNAITLDFSNVNILDLRNNSVYLPDHYATKTWVQDNSIARLG